MDAGQYQLFGSDKTVAALGSRIMARLPEIAQKDVLLITREDLSPGYKRSGQADIELARRNLTDLFNKAGLTDFDENFIDTTLDNIFSEDGHYAAIIGIDDNGNDTLGMIISPDLDTSAEKIVSSLANLPEEGVKNNLPGTGRDYVDAVLYHEAQHLNQNTFFYNMMTLPYEVDADRRMIQEIGDAAEDGSGMDRRVADAIIDARNMGGLNINIYSLMEITSGDVNKTLSTHSTHLGISQAEANGLPHDAAADPIAVINVNTVINHAVGLFLQAEGLKQLEDDSIPPEEKIFADTGAFMNSVAEPNSYADFVGQYMQYDPAMTYQAVKAVREKGYIPDNTPQAEYADNILSFFENHVDLEGLATPHSEAAQEFFSQAPSYDDLQSSMGPAELGISAPSNTGGVSSSRPNGVTLSR